MIFIGVSCEKDSINQKEIVSAVDYEFTTIAVHRNTLEKELPSLFSKITVSATKNSVETTEKNSQQSYVISEYGIYMELGDYSSYTFRVTNIPLKNNVQNIVFSQHGDKITKVYLVEYDLTEEEKKKIIKTEYVNLEGKLNWTARLLNPINVGDGEWRGELGEPCEPEFVYTTETYCTYGNHDNGELKNGKPCPGNATRIVVNVDLCPSGGGGGTGPDDPNEPDENEGTTTPVISIPFTNFYNTLNADQTIWWNFTASEEVKAQIQDFLDDSYISGFTYPQEAEDAATQAIDAYRNNTTIVESPDDPIEDLEDYLDCFNLLQGATITLYADQPYPNNPNIPITSSLDVGHAFISIDQGNKTASYGFYPETGVGYPNPTNGTMGNDENHSYDVSVTINVSYQTLQDLYTHSLSFAQADYDLQETNCTDFALSAGNIVGFNIPESQCTGSFVIGEGATPGMFGEYLQNMTLPSGATRDNNGGNAPTNNNCQ